ncbi:MAG: hypothetical protein AAFX78_15655 [Cyanobacteria bacterium J06638_20]
MIDELNGRRSPNPLPMRSHKPWNYLVGGAIALLLTVVIGEGAIAASLLHIIQSTESQPPETTYEQAQTIYIHRRESGSRQRQRGEPLRRPPDAIPPSATDACITLTAMANIAYLWDLSSELSDEVESRQVAVCRGRETEELSQGIPQWSNRRTMRLGSNWYYPNGRAAQFSDYWNYPNGRSVNFGSTWNYPDGSTARFSSSWYTPDGQRVSEDELLAIACAEVGSRRCADRLDEVRGGSDFWYTLTLIQLAWLGEQIEEGRIDPD